MSKIDFLKEQIIEARTFVNRLMSELPEDLWYVIPEGTDSNFIWQGTSACFTEFSYTDSCYRSERKGGAISAYPKI